MRARRTPSPIQEIKEGFLGAVTPKGEDKLASLREKGIPGRGSSLSKGCAVKTMHMKVPSIGLQHFFEKHKAGGEPRPTGLGAGCGTDELGRVCPGSCIIYCPSYKLFTQLPDDLWCLLSYLWAPGR